MDQRSCQRTEQCHEGNVAPEMIIKTGFAYLRCLYEYNVRFREPRPFLAPSDRNTGI